MGKVVCGRHGSTCCWRCDECPKCSGKFTKVGRGDYCPTCRDWLKANGYVFSTYRMDYVKAEDLPADLKAKEKFEIYSADFTCCGLMHTSAFEECSRCHKPLPLSKRNQPRTEQTQAGRQVVVEDIPARTIPDQPLKPKRTQTEKPMPLELVEIEKQQGKLF